MDARDRQAIKTLIDRRVRLLRADDPPEQKPYTRQELTPLTDAQLTVLRLAALGLSTYAAARFLDRSRITVQSHRKAALRRLDAHTVTQAVAIAFRQGLLWPADVALEAA